MKNFLLLAGTVLGVKPRFLHEPEKPDLSFVDAKKAEIFGPRFEIDDELENIIGKIHTINIGYIRYHIPYNPKLILKNLRKDV